MTLTAPAPADLVPYEPQAWVDVPVGATAPPGAVQEDAAGFTHIEDGVTRAHKVAVAAWTAVQDLGGAPGYDGGVLL